jgi:D-cysteine desulfhydrase
MSPGDALPPAKLPLAHLPTRIEHYPELDALVGTEVWVKRDDATAGAESGNKIRKLEYLLADAQRQHATTVITCGGLQSNHARATALLCRRLQLRPLLLLRTAAAPSTREGNVLLDWLCSAELRFIDHAQYAAREGLMSELARELDDRGERPYIIPEGGSNGVGALGYRDAMAEVRAQLDADPGLPRHFDAVVHACGSGGTSAGLVLGARAHGVADEVLAMAVCDDRAYFEARIGDILADAASALSTPSEPTRLRILDAYKGPAYGVASAEQLAFIRKVATCCGLVLDPVYSGKALFGLAHMPDKPRRALFIHTGGLPGLLADHACFAGLAER